jgi:sulfate adenylyltransferase subunit 1 (EFTu-like GTPase family)
VVVLPSGKKNSVSSVRVWNDDNKKSAKAGESIGIVLANDSGVSRGDVIFHGEKPVMKNVFDTDVFWLSKESVSEGDELSWRCATQEVPCVVEKIKKKIDSSTLEELENNGEITETEVGKLVLRTERPVVFQNFHDIESLGRFVLVRNDETLAGGVIA